MSEKEKDNIKEDETPSRRNKLKKIIKNILRYLTMILCVLILFGMATQLKDDAAKEEEREYLYTSYQIQYGDTISTIIAKRYDGTVTMEVDGYNKIKENILYTNTLLEDSTIHEGSYLILPYYEEDADKFDFN